MGELKPQKPTMQKKKKNQKKKGIQPNVKFEKKKAFCDCSTEKGVRILFKL